MNASALAALAVAVGTLAGRGRPGLALAFVCASFTAIAVAALPRRHRVRAGIAACAAVFFASGASAAWRSAAEDHAILPKLAAKNVSVHACGTVARVRAHSIEMGSDSVTTNSGRWRSREPAAVAGQGVEKLTPGQRICVSGRAHPARRNNDPPVISAARVSRHDGSSPIRLAASRVRERFLKAAQLALPRQPAGLLLGMTDGDTTLLSDSVNEDFRTTGLAHIVAVSGYNVAVFLAITTLVLRVVVRRHRLIRAAIAAVALVFFAFLTGLEPSVLRATVSAGIVLAATASGRRADALRAACVAFALIVLAAPDMLFSIGFQLSFGATAGIILASEPIERRITPFVRSRVVASALATTIAAQLAVAPVLAWHFGRVPGLGGLANLVAVPLGGLVMIGGIVTLSAASLVPFLDWAPATLRLPLDAILWSAHHFAKLPGASIATGVLVACAAAALLLASLSRSGNARTCLVGTAVLCIGFGAGGSAARTSCDAPFVSALDVGQGTAVVVRDGDHALLFDAGPHGAGVVSQLHMLGIDDLDGVVVSHSHIDHALGAIEVMRGMRVGRLYGPAALLWASGGEVIAAARQEGIGFTALSRGDELSAGPIYVRVLWPDDETLPPFASDQVDANSLVALAKVGGVDVLFPGDIRAEQQSVIAASGAAADVLVAPHHGSRNLDLRFVSGVGEGLTLVTVGAPNPYGLPAAEAIRAYARRGPVLRTDQDGRVTVCLKKSGAEVTKTR